jgi:hypothetical protein
LAAELGTNQDATVNAPHIARYAVEHDCVKLAAGAQP